MPGVQVPFAVTREVAFDYLVDPLKRPQWQSSLRRVDDVGPMPPQVGTAWRDVALGGVASQMELTVVERPARWAERGTGTGPGKGVVMDLELAFEETTTGCLVTADVVVAREEATRLLRALTAWWLPKAVRRDLVRAAGILEGTRQPRDAD